MDSDVIIRLLLGHDFCLNAGNPGSIKLLLRVFAEELLANLFGGFGTVLDLEGAGGFEFVEVFHDKVGDVEFEARRGLSLPENAR